MMDTIFVDNKEIKIGNYYLPPREPASDPNYIKHVHCDGARFHVLSWSGTHDPITGKSGARTHCSEPNCIINKAALEQE